MKDLKVVFMGTPEFAVSILDALIQNTNVVMVVSQPDKLVGRKKILTSSPVKARALENGIEVYTPNKIREDFERIREVNPDTNHSFGAHQFATTRLCQCPRFASS